MTTTTTTATLKSRINAATLAAFIRHSDAVTTVQAQGAALVEESKWTALERLIGATVVLGQDVLKLCKTANVKTADALHKSFRDEDSPVFVAVDQRKELPSASKMSNAMALAERHSDERLSTYRTATDDAGNTNSARIQDYVVWLNITVTGKTTSNRIDIDAMKITGKGTARKVGPLVRIATATTSKGEPTSPNTIGFFSDLLKMSADELAQVVNAEGAPDISAFPSARLREIARCCMARATMEEMSEKLVLTI